MQRSQQLQLHNQRLMRPTMQHRKPQLMHNALVILPLRQLPPSLVQLPELLRKRLRKLQVRRNLLQAPHQRLHRMRQRPVKHKQLRIH